MADYSPTPILVAISLAWFIGFSSSKSDGNEAPAEPPYVVKQISGVNKNRLLPPGKGNPRNSEGDFVQLKDGSLLFIYTHFVGGGGDHDAAYLASRRSYDEGQTWTDEDEVVLQNEGGFNVMSISLLRLQDGEIGLFYLLKESERDCRPMMRRSRDEGKTWSEAVVCVKDEVGYYVLNNDRAVQLASGRLLLPLAWHHGPDHEKADWKGKVMCYLSDDGGATWRRSQSVWSAKDPKTGAPWSTQEPGVVERADGSLLMYIRSDAGSQLQSVSHDGGDTWSEPVKWTLVSPASPASVERVPGSDDLMAVWNNHQGLPEELVGRRTPFTVAISKDGGLTWDKVKVLEDDPNGWYCYTAIEFVKNRVILGHCAGDRRKGGLNVTQVTSFPLDWLYQ